MTEKEDLTAAMYLAEPNVVKDGYEEFQKFLDRLDLKAILALQVLLSQRALALQMHAVEAKTVIHNQPKKKLIF